MIPAGKLPFDILFEIFLASTDHQRDLISQFDNLGHQTTLLGALTRCRKQSHPPWYLAHVCSHWRAAALGLPALWTHIHLDLAERIAYPYRRTVFESLHALIQNAGPSAHLTISLYIGYETAEKLDTRILDLLLSTASRWERLFVYDSPPLFSDLLRQLHPELLSLKAMALEGDPRQLTKRPRITEAPNVVRLGGDAVRLLGIVFNMPLSSITHLYVVDEEVWNRDDFQKFFNVFPPQFVQLKNLSLHYYHRSTAINVFQPITLTALTHLSLDIRHIIYSPDSYTQTRELLPYLTLPALEILDLTAFHLFDTILSFIQRSSCPLKHLALGTTPNDMWEPLSSEQCLQLMTSIPQIRTLLLGNAFVDLDLMTRLSAKTTEGGFELIPQLDWVEGLYGVSNLDEGGLPALKAAHERLISVRSNIDVWFEGEEQYEAHADGGGDLEDDDEEGQD